MGITLADIKELREKSNAPMMDVKNALEEANGDFEKAMELLRKRGAEVATKRAGKDASEGIVSSYVHANNKIGVLLTLVCETDFVAKNEEFLALGHDLAMQVAASNPKYVSPEEVPEEELENEKKVIMEMFKEEKKPQEVLDKIAEGKINKFKDNLSLLKQSLVKNPDMTVEELLNEKTGKLGEKIEIKQFVRYEL